LDHKLARKKSKSFTGTAKEELRNRGEGAGDPLYNLYAQNLGREPTIEEYRKSREQFGGDVSGQEEQQFFEQEVVPDLRRRQDPIFQLYQEELGRTPDAAVTVTTKKSLVSPPTLPTGCVKIF
jgi:hypothetical protein